MTNYNLRTITTLRSIEVNSVKTVFEPVEIGKVSKVTFHTANGDIYEVYVDTKTAIDFTKELMMQ